MIRPIAKHLWLVAAFSLFTGEARALSLLHYNMAGNNATNWTTNSLQVQALGRQMLYWQPEVVTFNEVPYPLSGEMGNFVATYLPGYFLAMNSGTDGFIRSAIASRHPITRSQSWMDGASLVPFGYTVSPNTFTRDLFEAEIALPGWPQHLHVFTTHLKATSGSGTNFTNSLLRRAAEASAVSNFFVNTFLPTKGGRPYVLTGDLNEDIARPPTASAHPIERLLGTPTGLRLTTPVNPLTHGSNSYSIRSSLSSRLDYILPCALLYSNIASAQVFRTDQLVPRPPPLLASDSSTASDHLPVVMSFHNPYDPAFHLETLASGNQFQLTWQTVTGRTYRVERSTNTVTWIAASSNLVAATTNLTWSTNLTTPAGLFRVQRVSFRP